MDSNLSTVLQQKSSTKDFSKFPEVRTGMEVEVVQKITEWQKSRLQTFKGLVIKTSGKTAGEKTFTVRRVSSGTGIEKVFPIACPTVEEIRILREFKTRRKNLTFFRDRKGKAARIKEKLSVAVNQDTPEA